MYLQFIGSHIQVSSIQLFFCTESMIVVRGFKLGSAKKIKSAPQFEAGIVITICNNATHQLLPTYKKKSVLI